MKKNTEPSGYIDNVSGNIKSVMLKGMFYSSDGEVSVGYLGEEGDIANECAHRYFLRRNVNRFVAYDSLAELLGDLTSSKISYAVLNLARSDKGSNFSLLDLLLEDHCYIKDHISFPLDSLRLFSRHSEENEPIRTVYIPMSTAEAEWQSNDNSISVCYTPTLFAAVSMASRRENAAILTHPFAASAYYLHETTFLSATQSNASLCHAVLSRNLPMIQQDRYLLFRKDVPKGDTLFDMLGNLESKGLSICRVETQCTALTTRLYITGQVHLACSLTEQILSLLGIEEHEFLGSF